MMRQRHSSHSRSPSFSERILSFFSDEKKPLTETLDAEALTAQERLSRLLHTPKPKAHIPTEGPIYDHFIVVGLPSCDLDGQPKILFSFPPDKPCSTPGVENFCFPDGVESKSLSVTHDKSQLIKLLHSKSYLQHPEDAYAFLFTDEAATTYYGVCIQKTELLEAAPRYVPFAQVPKGFHARTRRCYCLITRFPFFRFHFDFLESLFAAEHLESLQMLPPSIGSATNELEVFLGGTQKVVKSRTMNDLAELSADDTETDDTTQTTTTRTLTRSDSTSFTTASSAAAAATAAGSSSESVSHASSSPVRIRSAGSSSNMTYRSSPLSAPSSFESPPPAELADSTTTTTTTTTTYDNNGSSRVRLSVPLHDSSDRTLSPASSHDGDDHDADGDSIDTGRSFSPSTPDVEEMSSTSPAAAAAVAATAVAVPSATATPPMPGSPLVLPAPEPPELFPTTETDPPGSPSPVATTALPEQGRQSSNTMVASAEAADATTAAVAASNQVDLSVALDETADDEDDEDEVTTTADEQSASTSDHQHKRKRPRLLNRSLSNPFEPNTLARSTDGVIRRPRHTVSHSSGQSPTAQSTPAVGSAPSSSMSSADGTRERPAPLKRGKSFGSSPVGLRRSTGGTSVNIESVSHSLDGSDASNGTEAHSLDDSRSEFAKPSADRYDSAVLNALDRYRMMKVPEPGRRTTFKPTQYFNSISFTRPFFDEEEELFAEWGLPITFKLLNMKIIVLALSAILLEKKIAFVSPNNRVLSSVVLSFLPLIRPFVYQSVIIPILPQNMYSFLEAPVPFIVGLTRQPRASECPRDVVYIDVERSDIRTPEALPKLPFQDELKRKCDPLIRKLHKSCGKTLPYRTSKEQMQYVEQLSSIFEASFAQLFADFHEYTIRDLTDPDNPITVFMKESFLADLAATDVEFTRPFLESQLFFEYSDKKLRKRDDKHSKSKDGEKKAIEDSDDDDAEM